MIETTAFDLDEINPLSSSAFDEKKTFLLLKYK